ncbi:hypothetical protein ILYODFUR_036668 [Ilyodon furcidens]|uniref:Uncharacterized protein n=1 Tax=Ilyodon furcidens TaxID=33524 RepID=A0ABV0U222_9TELE
MDFYLSGYTVLTCPNRSLFDDACVFIQVWQRPSVSFLFVPPITGYLFLGLLFWSIRAFLWTWHVCAAPVTADVHLRIINLCSFIYADPLSDPLSIHSTPSFLCVEFLVLPSILLFVYWLKFLF